DDLGSVLKCTITLKENLSAKSDAGRLDYRCFIKYRDQVHQLCLSVTDAVRLECGFDAAPRAMAYRTNGKTIEMYYSKVLLAGARKFNVDWDAVNWGPPIHVLNSQDQLFTVELRRPGGEVDLSVVKGPLSGNVFEVFHYPLTARNSHELLRHV